MKTVIFATGNKAKLNQLRFVADFLGFPIEIVGGKERFGEASSYEEIGETTEDVARNGALLVARTIGHPVLTEDTDFRIDALDGAPGIRAGEFLKNHGRGEILKRMDGIANRRARITSTVAYATPDGSVTSFTNVIEGTVAHEESFADFPQWVAPSAGNAFGGGYNAIFIPDGHDVTLAQISPEDAMPWSYREKNFADALKYLMDR